MRSSTNKKESPYRLSFSIYRYALLVQILDQLGQRVNSFLLVAAVGDQRHGGALHNAQAQHAQQALGIDAALFLLYPDAALELVGLLDKIRSGSGVQTDLVLDCDLPCIHETALLTHNFVLPRQRVQRAETNPHHFLLYWITAGLQWALIRKSRDLLYNSHCNL